MTTDSRAPSEQVHISAVTTPTCPSSPLRWTERSFRLSTTSSWLRGNLDSTWRAEDGLELAHSRPGSTNLG